MTKELIACYFLLLCAGSVHAQQNDGFYNVTITGASSIMLNQIDERSFNYGIDHPFVYGIIYANESGNIRLNLPKGQYEYIAEKEGMRAKHGTFYISTQDIAFDVHLNHVASGVEDESLRSSRQMVHDGDLAIGRNDYKRARDLFRQAAVDGHADGMYQYAFMLKNGVGGQKDKEQAVFWLKEALSHGHYYAEYRLQYFDEKWRWGVSSGYRKATKFIQ